MFVERHGSPAYTQESTLKLSGSQYGAPALGEFTSDLPRVLAFGRFAGQIVEKCIKDTVEYRRIPLAIFGGPTSLLQPADLNSINQKEALCWRYARQRLLARREYRLCGAPQKSRSDVIRAGGLARAKLTESLFGSRIDVEDRLVG